MTVLILRKRMGKVPHITGTAKIVHFCGNQCKLGFERCEGVCKGEGVGPSRKCSQGHEAEAEQRSFAYMKRRPA